MAEYYEPSVDSAIQSEENKIVNTALTKLQRPYLSGLKLNADIALYRTSTEAELTFNTIDANNVVWVISDIEGWWNLPENEVPDLPRGWGDGSYDAIGRWSNRLLTLTGSFLPQDPTDAAAARKTLFDYTSNLVRDRGAGYLIVNENEFYDIVSRRIAFDASISAVNNGSASTTGATREAGSTPGTYTANAIYTTSADHLYVVGDTVTISNVIPSFYNIENATISAVTSNTFTIDTGTSDTSTEYLYVSGGDAKVNKAVYTVAEGVHAYVVGDSVDITNTSPNAFDVTDGEVTAITSNTFTISKTVTESYTSGGTATHPYAKYTTSTNHNIAVGDYLAIPNGADIEVVAVTSNTVTIDGVVGVEAIESNKLIHKIRKAAKVRLSGVPQITSVNARGRHDFSIGLKAVDPIKYEFVTGHPEGYNSVEILSNGSTVTETITNKGNIAVPVIFEISAAFPDPSAPSYAKITANPADETITILAGTDADVKMEIDTYNREVLEVDYSTVVLPTDEPGVTNARAKVSVLVAWIYLQPGANDITLTGFPSGSSCTVYFRSGWIG